MLRDSLRIHTRPHHERIEQALDLPESVRNREDFRRLLVYFYGFYLPHEIRLRSHTSALESYGLRLDERLKSEKICEDLLSLGMSTKEIGAIALCVDLPDLRTVEHALGSMYVLEGSTLGSQVIVRALKKKAELNIMSAIRFLSGYGASTGTMWRLFVDALDAAPLQSEHVLAAHEGAVHTFQSLERWMRGFASPRTPVSTAKLSPSPC